MNFTTDLSTFSTIASNIISGGGVEVLTQILQFSDHVEHLSLTEGTKFLYPDRIGFPNCSTHVHTLRGENGRGHQGVVCHLKWSTWDDWYYFI